MIPIAKPLLSEDIPENLKQVFESGIIAQGPRVKDFEYEFANFLGVEYAVAVNSGTSALHTALLAHDIGSGDEVVTTPFSFIASANSILYCRAKPLFADIKQDTYNIDPQQVLEKITSKTKAVLGVHLYGHPFDLKAVREICDDHKLVLIEDACQAHGAEYDGVKVGGFGTGCFSFYPTKNMTTGEGGIITTNDESVAEKCRVFRNHGSSEKYLHETLGFNYRMTDMAAVIGLSQIGRIDEFNNQRRNNAHHYNKLLNAGKYGLPVEEKDCRHVYHQYTIRTNERDRVIQELKRNNVGYGVHYPLPITSQPLYKKLGLDGAYPIAEQAASEVLSIPVHPGVTRNDIDFISEILNGL